MTQSFVCLHHHIIFSAKDRAACLNTDVRPRLFEYMGGVLRAKECRLVAAGGTADHAHLLVDLNKEMSVAEVVRVVKANTSKWLRQEFAGFEQFAWQPGYAAFAVSRSNLDDVRRYIENQEEHHRKRTFREELIAFLDRHGVAYDARWMPD